jgi:hypothetical protein
MSKKTVEKICITPGNANGSQSSTEIYFFCTVLQYILRCVVSLNLIYLFFY